MKFSNCLLLLFLGFFMLSCGENAANKKSAFSINFINDTEEFQLGDTLKAEVKPLTEKNIDSVAYFLNGEKISGPQGSENLSMVLSEEKLGKWDLIAKVYSAGEESEIKEEITILNDSPPVTYTYKIIATYPHSSEAYTQGLEFYQDTLYESTGQYGESTLRKVDLETGEVLKSVELDKSYFAEGMTILNDKIYQLTWREREGFIYDVNTFERIGRFAYNQSKEGWGLTNDGEKLYKSDGTEKIWILDPETLAEEGYIQTVAHNGIKTQLNELEWVEGKIYANTYQHNGVAIINPENGAIEGVINFSGLADELGNKAELDPSNDVLNGIAYNKNTGKLYVTGKNWDKLFEVEIVKK